MTNSETVKFKGYTIFKNYEAHSKKIIEHADIISKCTGVDVPKDMTGVLIGSGSSGEVLCTIGLELNIAIHRNGDIYLTVLETPKKHLAHPRRSTYRCVTTVWDLCKLIKITLGESNIKPHVDKYISAMNSSPDRYYRELIDIVNPSELKHKTFPSAEVISTNVEIGAVLSKTSAVPKISCMYKIKIKGSDINVKK